MSSGTAMNRKIQREGGSMTNSVAHNGRSVNENMTQSRIHPRVALRQKNDNQSHQSPIKHLTGTPVQKNWYLLSVHEKRLNRLEAWVQMIMAGRMNESNNNDNREHHDISAQQRQEVRHELPPPSSGDAKKIQHSKTVTLEVNETNT